MLARREQRLGVLDARATVLERADRRLVVRRVAGEDAERAVRAPERARCAEARRERELLAREGDRFRAGPERERGTRAPRPDRRVRGADAQRVLAARQPSLMRPLVLAEVGVQPGRRVVAPGGEEPRRDDVG